MGFLSRFFCTFFFLFRILKIFRLEQHIASTTQIQFFKQFCRKSFSILLIRRSRSLLLRWSCRLTVLNPLILLIKQCLVLLVLFMECIEFVYFLALCLSISAGNPGMTLITGLKTAHIRKDTFLQSPDIITVLFRNIPILQKIRCSISIFFSIFVFTYEHISLLFFQYGIPVEVHLFGAFVLCRITV